MKVTSAEASKMLAKLNDNKEKILSDERRNCVYNAAVGENPDDNKPDYSFEDTKAALEKINDEIIRIKHAINVFNTTTEVVPGMTIDMALIKMPILTHRIVALDNMRNRSKKERFGSVGNTIDYRYTAYDPDDATDEYAKLVDEKTELQLALDTINHSVTFEI